MKSKNQIILDGTNVVIGPNEMFYLSYSTEKVLCDFLIKRVLANNFRPDERTKPLSIFIGDHEVINSVNKAIHEIPSGAMGNLSFLSETRTHALKEFIHQQLKSQKHSMLILSGFNEIKFVDRSEHERNCDIDMMLVNLRKLQSEFEIPILIAGTTKHGDENTCVPALSSHWSEVEVYSNECYDIKAKVGHFKLFHLPKENPAPTSQEKLRELYGDL